MILTGMKIKEEVRSGYIVVHPFNALNVQPNSIDLTLAPEMEAVLPNSFMFSRLDKTSKTAKKKLVFGGFILWPGRVYLGITREFIGSNKYVPKVHGRSSVGRHGLAVHITAGFGDIAWFGRMVLELVNHNFFPIWIPAGVRVCQIEWAVPEGEIVGYTSTYNQQNMIKPGKGLT